MCIDKKERNTPILELGKYEYKYLSPAVYKIKNIFYLLYCNRLKSKNFYGEINIASSKDLFNWKKENIKILPPYKGIYTSLASPSLVSIKGKYYLFVEAQTFKKKSDILCYETINFIDWKQNLTFFLSCKKGSLISPFIYKSDKKITLYYSYDTKIIKSLQLNEELQILKVSNCITKELSSEKYSIYAPNILKIKKKYVMLYSAWNKKESGNINIALSEDGKVWKKKSQQILKKYSTNKIVSEPFALLFQKKIYIFYEYEFKKAWNIKFLTFKESEFIDKYIN